MERERAALRLTVFLSLVKESRLTWKRLQDSHAKQPRTEAADISEDVGSPGSHCQDDPQRKGLASHTPKVGPVSKSNRTFFSFIKYLDNWKVPVNGYLFQL